MTEQKQEVSGGINYITELQAQLATTKAELHDERERHAALQSRCYEGYPSASDGIFDWLLNVERELAAAKARIKELEGEKSDFHMQYRMKADSDTKAADQRAWQWECTAKANQELVAELRAELEKRPPDEWGVDTSTGRPILVYKNCSVIEGDQAQYVLRVIAQSALSGLAESQKPLGSFYRADTKDALIEAMERHILRLQDKLPKHQESAFTHVREG